MSNNKQPVATQGLTMEDRDASTGFLLDFAKRGRNRGRQPSPSICKVPRILRDLSVRSFIPQLVSIGPIHRENKKLKEFEWLKGYYLDDLLNRCHDSTQEEKLDACLQKVNDLIPHIRESYADVKKNYSDVELARMMVMDGCFILEFCFKHSEEEDLLPNKMQNLRIAMDLMLLENQVPFVVLQALFNCCMGKGSFSLSEVLDAYLAPYIKLFHSQTSKKIPTTDVDSDSTPAHVLGYLHKRYQLQHEPAKSSNPLKNKAFPSIEELHRAGVNFKPYQPDVCPMTIKPYQPDVFPMTIKPDQPDEWPMTIKFQSSLFVSLPWRSATLLMPTLFIDDTTELILRNFIAYEQSFPQDRYYFTSYAHAMDTLIDTQEDIAKLVESDVIVNRLGSNQEAADMINKICKNTVVTDFYYTQEFKQMDKYYNGYGDKELALLRRSVAWQIRVYRSDPWKFTALYSAIILFCLTVVQTVYTIRAAK